MTDRPLPSREECIKRAKEEQAKAIEKLKERFNKND